MSEILHKNKVKGLKYDTVTASELAGMNPADYTGLHLSLQDANLNRVYDVYSNGVEWVIPYDDDRAGNKIFTPGTQIADGHKGLVPPPPAGDQRQLALCADGTWKVIPGFTPTWEQIADKPTTIAGYGITDAYISDGTIYLGGQSITPLVSSDLTQALIIQVLGYTPYDSARLDSDVTSLIDARVYYDTTGAAHTIHIGSSQIDLNDYVTVATFNNEVTILSNADTDLSTRIGNEVTARSQADTTLQSYIDIINGKIPSAASTTNQLADKAYVTSMVASATADFKGSWSTWTAVPTDGSQYPTDSEGGHTPKANDYMVVLQDETHSGQTWRYKYSGTWSVDGKSGWLAEYMVSDAPFTSDQLAAINSGITSTLVTRIGLNRQDIISLNNTKQNTITGAASTVTLSNLNSNLVLVSSPTGKIAASTITTSELAYLSGLTTNVQSQFNSLDSTYQHLDADLTAIAALTGTSGYLKKTAANTWTLDTNSYITQVDMQLYLAQNYVSQTSLATTLAGYDPMYGTNSGSYSHAIGRGSVASGQYAVATGYNSTASANYAVAMGLNAVASQQNAWALGANTVAAGNNAIAMGYDSVVLANFGMALGAATYVMTQYGISNSTTARTNIATETLSEAISNSRTYTTTVASDLSVGMVVLNSTDVKTPLAVITAINRTTNVVTLSAAITVASGQTLAYRKGNSYSTASVAEGYQTASIGGYGSHAEGRYTTAQGQASHAEGWGTWTTVAYQHAVGKWNATGNFAEVVGNGTSETQRSNIRTLDWNGNEWVAGNITAGGYIDVSAVKIGGTTINLANAWLQGTATASNVIWVETSGNDYILHIGTTAITVSATGTATSIAWSGITGVPLTLTALGNLAGTTNYGFLKLSGTNQITVDTNSYALALHTHTTNEITDFPQLAEVATSGSYNDLLDLPVLQSVNDATLTLKVNGTTVTTFSANASQNKEFDVDLSSFHSGTVTSVGLTAPAGFEVSDSPITTSGTLALSFATGYSLPTTASQSEWDDAYSATNAATNVNTASTIVKRDANGNFIAGTITANLTGNATTATTATKLGSTSVGSGAKPIWLNQGTPTASTNTIGSATRPIYLNAGTLTAGTYTIASNVPANAVFTDTTYSAGVGLKLTGTTFAVNYGQIASGNTLPVSGGAIFTKLADYALITSLATVATTGSYDDLTGIPETFTPAAHTHEWSTISYKPAIIAGTDGLASLNNTTTYGFLKLSAANTITVDTNSYALTTHTHTISDITNFPTLATVATSGSYTDLDDKPTIPTVYDGVLTLKVNGTTITTFSANSSQNKAFNVDLSEFGGGTVTSVDLSVPTGFVVTGNPVTTSGTLTLAFAAEYSLPTTASQTNWTEAYTATSAATSLNTASTIVKRDASGNFKAGVIKATLNGSASKLGTATVGSGVKFIYLDNGNPTVSNSTLGGANQPIWLDNGQLKQCNAFAPVSHTHDWRYDITNKPDTLAGYGITDAYTKAQSDARYAPKAHTHTVSDITDLTLADVATSGLYSDLDGIPLTFAPSAHTHDWDDDITDKPDSLGGYGITDAYTKTEADTIFAAKAQSLAGYGITDATITEEGGYTIITLGENSVSIDTSGTVSDINWAAINDKPPIIAGQDGLAGLGGTTTYGILRLKGTNTIRVDTTNYANQNAFSNVLVGTTTISANSTTDTLILLAGSNVTLTPSTTTKSVTISATDTTYSPATQSGAGLMSAADKVKLDGIAAGANNYSLPTADDNTLGGVKTGYSMPSSPSNRYYAVDLDVNDKMFVEVPWENTTYTQATQSEAGLMSAADKTKLDNIEANANFYELPTASASTLGGVKIGYIDNEKNYRVQLDNDKMFVSVPWTDTTYDDATQIVHGLMSTADKTKLDGIAVNANNYSLPTANDNTLGGVKTGYTATLDKYYAVKVDASGNMYVNVDWQNTEYTLPEATSVALGGVKIGYESQDNQDYPVQLDTNGKMFVSVPWTDTPYLLPLATGETLGGVKIGYSESGRHYAVRLFNEKMYVKVPWTDTTYQMANDSTFGLVKIGYSQLPTPSNRNYAVRLNPSGQMYVNVDWDNTEYSAGNGLTLTNNTFAVEFGNIANNGSKAVTGGTIYNYLANYVQKARDLDFGRLVVASGTYAIDTVNFVPVASVTEWDDYNDTYLPTMKSVTDYIGTLGYTANEGTVTSIEIIAGVGIGVSPTGAITTSGEVTVTNMGVRAVTTGSLNGTISVDTGGDTKNVKVKGIDTAAYKKEEYFAEASHNQGWNTITDTPTTLRGYDIRDAYTKTQTYNKTEADARFAPISHTHSWLDITDDKPNTLFGYGINNAYTKAEVDAMFGSLNVMTFKGSVPTVNNLPVNASIGDVYVVTTTGTPYVYDGTQWVSLALVDLTGYVTQAQLADYATIQYVTTYYATKTEITDMVTSTNMLLQGRIVIGGGNKRVQTLDYSIFPNSSYTGASDFEGVNADSYIPTAKAISSYVSGNYQPIGSYVTQAELNTALGSYATIAYVAQTYATQSAIENMVTSTVTLTADYIVLGNGTKAVKDSGVRILATGSWQSGIQYVPTTFMTDSRYAIRGMLQTGKLVTASNTNTVTATAYIPHRYTTGSSSNTWDGGDGYIPTEAMIDNHILYDMVGYRLQAYHIELTHLSLINKTLETGYVYWNGTGYELTTAGSGSGNVSTSGTLDNDYIILGAGGTSIKKSDAKITANSNAWSSGSPHIATIDNTMGYLSANYQPLNTYLTGISTLPSLSAGGYLYYNGTSWSFATPSGTGNVTAASTLTNGKLVRGAGNYGIATTNYEVASSGGGSPRTTWNDTSDVYVPTMASIYGRLVALATLTFAAGAFSAKTYTPSGSAKTINVPTSTSHLTNDSNFVTQSDLSYYVPYEQGDIRYLLRSGGNMSGTIGSRDIIPVANNQYDLGSSNSKYNNLYCTYINPIEIHHTSQLTGITFGNESLQLWAYTDSTPREQARISLWAGDGQDRPEVRLYGNIGAWGSTSQDKAIGTSSHPFSAIYLKAYHKTIKITVTDNGGIITDVLD